MYDILSPTNSTLLTADSILLCPEKTCTESKIHIPHSIENCASACWLGATPAPSDLVPPLPHLISCTTTNSNLYVVFDIFSNRHKQICLVGQSYIYLLLHTNIYELIKTQYKARTANYDFTDMQSQLN
jgi:hypothetical protein